MIIYAVKVYEADLDWFDRTLATHFDWGFYIAIGAAGLSVVTFILMCVTVCCMRD